MSNIITPYAARQLRKQIKDRSGRYAEVRRQLLAAKAEAGSRWGLGETYELRDRLVEEALEHRLMISEYRKSLATAEVRTGASWSEEGLENVRKANRR